MAIWLTRLTLYNENGMQIKTVEEKSVNCVCNLVLRCADKSEGNVHIYTYIYTCIYAEIIPVQY